MAGVNKTLLQIYDEKKGEIGTDTINRDLGTVRATPFSEDNQTPEIDRTVVSDAWLASMRSSKGLTLNTEKYSDTIDKNA